jgi:hypothetical protein
VSILLGAAIYFLATEPEVQGKLFVEAEEALGESNEKFTYESANKMQYMEMVISGKFTQPYNWHQLNELYQHQASCNYIQIQGF